MTSLYKNNVVSFPGYLSGCLSSLFITVFYHFIQEKSQTCCSALSQVPPTLLKRKNILVVVCVSSFLPLTITFQLSGNPQCRILVLQILDAGEGTTAFPSLSQQFMTSLAQTDFFFNFANRIVGILAENLLFLPQCCRRGDVLAGS